MDGGISNSLTFLSPSLYAETPGKPGVPLDPDRPGFPLGPAIPNFLKVLLAYHLK